jgi:F-type H+-transporting ATPase subunit b
MISIDLALVFQFVNFLLLMLVLNIFLYKPIRKILAERDSEIIESQKRTAAVDKEVQEKMALYEMKLRQTKTAAYEEKTASIGKAREEESAIIEKARLEAAQSLATIQKQVARDAEEARGGLREQARSISLEICKKVLGRSL